MDMGIGERIKAVRTALGVTQGKFAERLAAAASYISEIENAVREPNERLVRLVIAEFGVSEEWLRNGHGEMFTEVTNATVSEAVARFKSLDRTLQSSALKMLAIFNEINEHMKVSQ